MRGKIIGLILVLFFAVAAHRADAMVRAENIRLDHPRMFINADDLPALRLRAGKECKNEFDRMKKLVDALPADAPMILKQELFTVLPNGKIKPDRPSRYGSMLFVYNGGDQAVRAALLYLITGEKVYLNKAKSYLRLATQVFDWTAKAEMWVGWQANVQLNALIAYDWIARELTAAEKRELLLPILNYVAEAQPEGSFRFRRSIGGVEDGNYGEKALLYYAGLAAYGDGVDDERAADFLKRGIELFTQMLDHRERSSAGSGLLASSTVSYSFTGYPYATFHFFHTARSAFGIDVSERWTQMADYPNWFDWAKIRSAPGHRFLAHGIGDMSHADNLVTSFEMYTHLAQSIHFYGKKHPQKALQGYIQLARLPKTQHLFMDLYPFLPFLLNNFDPAKIATVETDQATEAPYFLAPAYGLLLLRSGTGETDTFAAFRCGAKNAMHQHYDELNLIIYKRDFLALDAGSRCETAHHHNFAAQSVAHNTLLIHQENEPMPPFWKAWGFKDDGKTYFNHGGQSNNTGGKLLMLESTDDFIAVAATATDNYSSAKCREAIRQLVYLKPDLFVVYDRVESVREDQRKEFLLHFQNRPTEIAPQQFQVDHGGRLFVRTLLPKQAQINWVGGKGREFFSSGRNWPVEEKSDWDKRYRLTGKWRMEVAAPKAEKRTVFLHLIQAALPETAQLQQAVLTSDDDDDRLCLTDPNGVRWELSFRRKGAVGVKIKATGADGKIRHEKAYTSGTGI